MPPIPFRIIWIVPLFPADMLLRGESDLFYAATAQMNHLPPCTQENTFSASFYKPYALAAQTVLLLCSSLRDNLRRAGADPGVVEMTYRLKTPASIGGKLAQKGLPVSPASAGSALHDVAGFRVVLETIPQVYRFAGLIAKSPVVEVTDTRDYIKSPKQSGYKSLHLLLSVPVTFERETLLVPVEVQLRTPSMDVWANAEHDLIYKPVRA